MKNTYHRKEWIGNSSVFMNLKFHPNHSCSVDPLGEGTHLLSRENDDSKHQVECYIYTSIDHMSHDNNWQIR